MKVSRSAPEPVAVVGSGSMGSGIVGLLEASGRAVLWGTRDPDSLEERIRATGAPVSTRAVSHQDALAAGIVLLALWHPDGLDFARCYAHAARGRERSAHSRTRGQQSSTSQILRRGYPTSW